MGMMDHNSGSANRSSSMVPSLADDSKSLDATSNFSSPVSATSSHGREFSTPIGLGISRCGLEPSFDTMGGFTSQLPYSMTPSIPTQIAPMDDFYSLPIKVSDFSDQLGFGTYAGFSETAPSTLRYYGSQAMSATSSYNSPIETASLQTTFPGQVPGYWIPTECSGPITPPDIVPIAAGNMPGSYWSAQCVPELCPTINAPVSHMAGGFSISGNSFDLQRVPVAESEDLFSKDVSDSGLSIPESPKSKQEEKVVKRSSVSRQRTASPPKKKSSSKKGYACRVCGFSFTRRSNCAEHEKKHDPNHRRSYPCEECHKTFGRMADLRRHTDNVHLGIRKHICNWCDRRFSRLDVLTRHTNECDKAPETRPGFEHQFACRAADESWMAAATSQHEVQGSQYANARPYRC